MVWPQIDIYNKEPKRLIVQAGSPDYFDMFEYMEKQYVEEEESSDPHGEGFTQHSEFRVKSMRCNLIVS